MVTVDNAFPLEDTKCEYDLAVIGGGSGGLAAAKKAASYGAKVRFSLSMPSSILVSV